MITLKAIISSTYRNLKSLRKDVMDACLRQGIFPLMMEHLPASDRDAIDESLRIVDEADIYIGIISNYYGYVPDGHDISITQMEYNRAKENGIPALIFLHEKKPNKKESPDSLQKLADFKEQLKVKHVVQFFKSTKDIRYLIINSLAQYRAVDYSKLHNVVSPPAPPQAFIAHPYILLQTEDIIGREYEFDLLDQWVVQDNLKSQSAIFCLVAIGGMGKSCITWKWFIEEKYSTNTPFKGKMWWSFYESDASFENFILRSLAYVKGQKIELVSAMSVSEREEELLHILNNEPFLITLDGIERILIAYAQLDAAKKTEDQLDSDTFNQLAKLNSKPSSKNNYKHYLRRTLDPRIGVFLQRLSQVAKSKILITSRLIPADFQDRFGFAIPGVKIKFLKGLKNQDALKIWRKHNVTGDKVQLKSLFNSFDNYPLLIRSLAGEVANYRPAPGNYEKWLENNKNFNPLDQSLTTRKSHVLSYSLRGLGRLERNTLIIIAAFRMPSTYDTLVAVLVGKGKIIADEKTFDKTLSNLEDRGLLGWDRQANRYDLHPIVRGVVWNNLGAPAKVLAYQLIQKHFEALPIIGFDEINVDDLSPIIELYNSFIGQHNFGAAFQIFLIYLNDVTLFKFNSNQLRIELLEALYQDNKPKIKLENFRVFYMNLGYSYLFLGNLSKALDCFIDKNFPDVDYTSIMSNLANTHRLMGNLYKAQYYASQALVAEKEYAFPMGFLGWVLAARGEKQAVPVLKEAIRLNHKNKELEFVALCEVYLSRYYYWKGDYREALKHAKTAYDVAHEVNYRRDIIRSNRALGYAYLKLDNLKKADLHLSEALNLSRSNLLDEEILALIGLAALNLEKGIIEEVYEIERQVIELIERGPYTIYKTELLLIMGACELAQKNKEKAISRFEEALHLSMLEGSPFHFHWGYESAKKQLKQLGISRPKPLKIHDASMEDPIPEINIL